MEYILIAIGIIICSILIFLFVKLIHKLVKMKIKLQTFYMIIMSFVLLPTLTILIYKEIGNYWSSPTVEDSRRLGEMTSKTIYSPDYKKIEREETIYGIAPFISRFNRPKDSYIYYVNVYTNKDTYMFSCDENTWVKVPKCKKVSIGSWDGVTDYEDGKTFFKGYKGFKDGKEK